MQGAADAAPQLSRLSDGSMQCLLTGKVEAHGYDLVGEGSKAASYVSTFDQPKAEVPARARPDCATLTSFTWPGTALCQPIAHHCRISSWPDPSLL